MVSNPSTSLIYLTDLEPEVPSPPRLILDRIKFLEERIISLERDYPPWAALHFNQPNRGVLVDFSLETRLTIAFSGLRRPEKLQ